MVVFVTHLEGVGLTQRGENLAQGHGLATQESTHVERAIVIPQGQTVGFDVEVGVRRHGQTWLGPVQWVDIRDEVTAGAVGLDELHHAGGLVHADVGEILAPAHWCIRHAHGLEDVIPESVIDEQTAHGAQELTGLCTLDDAVVIGGRDGDQLAHAHFAQAILGSASEFCWVIHGAHTDDGALALGQARHGVAGTDATRVGQGDGHAGEVIHGQLAVAGTFDDVLVLLHELGEAQGFRFLDGRHDQRTGAVLAHHVDSQTQVDVLWGYQVGLAIDLFIRVVHIGVSHDRADQGVTDDVGEANLPAATRTQGVVHHGAVFEHELGWHIAHRGSGGDLQREVHVLHHGLGCTADNGLARFWRVHGSLWRWWCLAFWNGGNLGVAGVLCGLWLHLGRSLSNYLLLYCVLGRHATFFLSGRRS